jgi:hypothetical protein
MGKRTVDPHSTNRTDAQWMPTLFDIESPTAQLLPLMKKKKKSLGTDQIKLRAQHAEVTPDTYL